ncbi:hypothetical protein HMPREF1370_03022, partial [Enterococcus faecium P1123]|uniref:hypothetical protein n=1 Tax=Enterococcus faecium TaxID=1352 RepID=UPI0002826349
EFVQNARNKKSYSIKRWQLVRLKPVILKGQKGSFEATIVLKEDFTTGFEFSEKKKTNFKKRTRRTAK